MDRLEVLSMEPGEKLDHAVAEFLGNEVVLQGVSDELGIVRLEPESGIRVFDGRLPDYSSSWPDVKPLIDQMNDEDFNLELIVGADGNSQATFMLMSGDDINRYETMVCDTPMEAICKAALLTRV